MDQAPVTSELTCMVPFVNSDELLVTTHRTYRVPKLLSTTAILLPSVTKILQTNRPSEKTGLILEYWIAGPSIAHYNVHQLGIDLGKAFECLDCLGCKALR
jgi:hypothetical protein